MLTEAPTTPPPPQLYPRQDVSVVDEAAASASVLSAQTAVFGQFFDNQVTAPGTTTVPADQIYFECPEGAEDTWKDATTHNGDLGRETTGQGCLASYTGIFNQAWFIGGITPRAGVYGCQNWDTQVTTWHWAYTPSGVPGQIMCIWDNLDNKVEHTLRVLNPPAGYDGGGQLWINGFIHAPDAQPYTTQTGTVVPTHSAPSYTSGQTSSTSAAIASSSISSTASSSTSASASPSPTGSTASSTSTSTSSSSPSSSASSSSSTSSGLSTNQIILVIAICCIIFFALIMVYCFVCRRKPPSAAAAKGGGGPVVYVREESVGKGMRGRRRRRVVEDDSGSEWSGSGSEYSGSEEEGEWKRRGGAEMGERRRMLR